MEVFPGCYYDVGECLKRPCRSSGSGESCLDNNVCCENTRTVSPGCPMGNLVTQVYKCSCRCSAPSVLIITGTVKYSITDLPITGIVITLVGTTFNTATNASGEFSFSSVPSQRRRIVAKASDPSGMYLDAYVIKTIPGSETVDQVLMNIAMTRKAPFTEIDPVVENRLSISGDPSAQNNGSAYLKVPANAFYNTDGTQYTGKVSFSLTYIDPSERLEDAPGEFVTLNSDGRSEILVTLGVFSIDFEDDSGNKLLLKNNIEVYTKQSTPYLLWQLDEQTGTWVLINTLTRRKKRQAAQEQLIGSFTPKTGKWYNIDYKLAEPDCFFKIRVFQSNFSELNEITNSRKVIPKVRQILSIGDGNGVKYSHGESLSGCFQIQCPTELAKASISVTHLIHYEDTHFRQVGSLPVPFRHVDKPLAPATVGDYSTAIKSILQSSQYNYYTLPAFSTQNLYVNTQMAETGPFYPEIDRCEAGTFDDPAFWFAEPPAFVEGDFYDGTEDRCVGRLSFGVSSVSDPDLLDNLKVAEIEVDVMSIWSDNTCGVKAASIKVTSPLSPPQDGSWYWISGVSCFEYRCSTENAMTSVYFAISNNTLISCSRSNVPSSPVLDSSEKEEGYYFNGMSNVEEALDRCYKDTENFVGYLNCGQRYS